MAGTNVLIKIGASTGGAVREVGKLDRALGKSATNGRKFSSVMGSLKFAAFGAAAAGAAVLTDQLIQATKAALEDAASQDKLRAQLERSIGATDRQVASVERWITKTSMAVAITDDELRPAYAALVRSTGDAAAAQDILTSAIDVSAATGKPLETVVKALQKAYDGNTGSLGKLGLGLGAADLKGKSFAEVMDMVNQKVGGDAERAAKTGSGQYKRLQIVMGELQETIGAQLLPAIEALLPYMVRLATWSQENADGIKSATENTAKFIGWLYKYGGTENAINSVRLLAQWGRDVASAFERAYTWVSRVWSKLSNISLPSGISLPGIGTNSIMPTAMVATPGARASRSSTGSSITGAGVVINITGAIDPEGTARQIRQILADSNRRNGR